MTDSIRHRGPDGEGFLTSGPVGLGHRRLAIIDLDTGDQPVYNETGEVGIVFNGEIYNYVELRQDLEARGHQFKTHSDTETIVHAYEEWGPECVHRFNGMWAFALWDERRRRLWLSRDRFGEKPLYYTEHDHAFWFGSEIKALVAAGIPARPDFRPLELYLTLSYVPAPYTMFQGIRQLEPGHSILVEDGRAMVFRYWEPEWVPEGDMRRDEDAICEEFTHLLKDSVRLRMRSDVPFGAFLSGGMDSSVIAYWMSRMHPEPVRTFTIGFNDKEYDERHLAAQVAKACRTRHQEFEVTPEHMEDALSRVIRHYDDPFGDSSAIPTGIVSSLAAREVKMVLTGDGGDEALSGYPAYQGEKFARTVGALNPLLWQAISKSIGVVRHLGGKGIRRPMMRLDKSWKTSRMSFLDRTAEKNSAGPGVGLAGIRNVVSDLISQRDYLDDLFSRCPFENNFYRLMYYHLTSSLPNDMLTKVDRMSMSCALEARVPFLDHRLVNLMTKVSSDVKMPGYERKHILRKVMRDKLPQAIWAAKKKGFAVPLSRWFADDKALNLALFMPGLEKLGISMSWVKDIQRTNSIGGSPVGNFLWMLMVLERWMGEKSEG